ncbi:plasmid mobilization protein, partial [Microseira wollei]|uniref:plasmid mobilization protein n=1 Tax=Microseira wollei TaxID=467598 RepID=UPI001CFE5D12
APIMKNKRITVRFEDEEYTLLLVKASQAGMSVSDYVRETSLWRHIRSRQIPTGHQNISNAVGNCLISSNTPSRYQAGTSRRTQYPQRFELPSPNLTPHRGETTQKENCDSRCKLHRILAPDYDCETNHWRPILPLPQLRPLQTGCRVDWRQHGR